MKSVNTFLPPEFLDKTTIHFSPWENYARLMKDMVYPSTTAGTTGHDGAYHIPNVLDTLRRRALGLWVPPIIRMGTNIRKLQLFCRLVYMIVLNSNINTPAHPTLPHPCLFYVVHPL